MPQDHAFAADASAHHDSPVARPLAELAAVLHVFWLQATARCPISPMHSARGKSTPRGCVGRDFEDVVVDVQVDVLNPPRCCPAPLARGEGGPRLHVLGGENWFLAELVEPKPALVQGVRNDPGAYFRAEALAQKLCRDGILSASLLDLGLDQLHQTMNLLLRQCTRTPVPGRLDLPVLQDRPQFPRPRGTTSTLASSPRATCTVAGWRTSRRQRAVAGRLSAGWRRRQGNTCAITSADCGTPHYSKAV